MPEDTPSGLGDDLFASPAPAPRDESTVEPASPSVEEEPVEYPADELTATTTETRSRVSRFIPSRKVRWIGGTILAVSTAVTGIVNMVGNNTEVPQKDEQKQSAPNVPVETAEQKAQKARVVKETQDVAAIDTMIAGIKTQLEDTRLTPDQRQDLEGQLQSFEKQRAVQEAERLNAEAAGEDVPAHLKRASEDTQDQLKGNN